MPWWASADERVVVVPLSPLVFLGIVLTLALFGAIIGVPLLLVVVRPWWASASVGLGRTRPQNWSTFLRLHVTLLLAAATGTFIACTIHGTDDLELGVDAAFMVVCTALLMSALYGGTRLLRAR